MANRWLLVALLSFSAHGQWSGSWPTKEHPRDRVVWAADSNAALVERISALHCSRTAGFTTNSTFNLANARLRQGRLDLIAVKDVLKNVIGEFVATTNITDIEEYVNASASFGEVTSYVDIETWTATGACAYVALPTNFLDVTFYRNRDGLGGFTTNGIVHGFVTPETIAGGPCTNELGFWTTSDYGWEGIKKLSNLCRYTTHYETSPIGSGSGAFGYIENTIAFGATNQADTSTYLLTTNLVTSYTNLVAAHPQNTYSNITSDPPQQLVQIRKVYGILGAPASGAYDFADLDNVIARFYWNTGGFEWTTPDISAQVYALAYMQTNTFVKDIGGGGAPIDITEFKYDDNDTGWSVGLFNTIVSTNIVTATNRVYRTGPTIGPATPEPADSPLESDYVFETGLQTYDLTRGWKFGPGPAAEDGVTYTRNRNAIVVYDWMKSGGFSYKP